MTNDEINETIAVSLGWKAYPYVVINGIKRNRVYWANDMDFDMDNPPPGTSAFGGRVPNFTEDLNAMHEVEMGLKGDKEDEFCEMADYEEHLCLVCGDGVEPLNVYNIDLIRAIARQRAEAYLRTIGKWREP